MVSTGFALDTKKDDGGLKYIEWLSAASASGKSLVGLVRKLPACPGARASSSRANIFCTDCLMMWIPSAAKKTFLGTDRLAQLLFALDMPWPEIAEDKPTLTARVRSADSRNAEAMLTPSEHFPEQRACVVSKTLKIFSAKRLGIRYSPNRLIACVVWVTRISKDTIV